MFIASILTQDESSYVVDAEYGVGGKNKVTHVTWFSFGTLQLLPVYKLCLRAIRMIYPGINMALLGKVLSYGVCTILFDF